jgi:hypothetical protein
VNLAACAALPKTPENNVWYRLIEPHHLGTALSSAHTKDSPSRYNPGRLLPAADRFSILYFAENPTVGQFEVGAMLGSPGTGRHVPHPKLSYVTLNVHIILSSVADLTEVATAQRPLETTAQELTGDWRGYGSRTRLSTVSQPTGTAPTQELGRALFLSKAEGFRTISAKVPEYQILAVFPENLSPGSSLTFKDHGAVVHRIP